MTVETKRIRYEGNVKEKCVIITYISNIYKYRKGQKKNIVRVLSSYLICFNLNVFFLVKDLTNYFLDLNI